MVELERADCPARQQGLAQALPQPEPDEELLLEPYLPYLRRTDPLTVQEQTGFSTTWMRTCRRAATCEKDIENGVAPNKRRFQLELEQRNVVRRYTTRCRKQIWLRLNALQGQAERGQDFEVREKLSALSARIEQLEHRIAFGDFDRTGAGLEVAPDPAPSSGGDSEDELVFVDDHSANGEAASHIVSRSRKASRSVADSAKLVIAPPAVPPNGDDSADDAVITDQTKNVDRSEDEEARPSSPVSNGVNNKPPASPSPSPPSAPSFHGKVINDAPAEKPVTSTAKMHTATPYAGSIRDPASAKRKHHSSLNGLGRASKRKRTAGRPSGLSDRLSAGMRTKVRRELTPLEDPVENEFHEAHLYSAHDLIMPDTAQQRKNFSLDDFVLFKSGQMVDLLDVDTLSKTQQGSYQLQGMANVFWDPAEVSEEILDHSTRRVVEWKRVVVSGFDIVQLAPTTGALWLETRHAKYCLLRPATGSERYLRGARLFLNYFAFARTRHVRGQMREGPALTVEQFNNVLSAAAREEQDADIDGGLTPAWDLGPSVLEELELDTRLTELLHKYLPDTPFVTPFVYDLVAPFLRNGTIRTLEHHDPVVARRDRQRDDAELQKYRDMVKKKFPPYTMSVGEPLPGRRMENSLPFGSGRKIEVFDQAMIRGKLYKAGDYILVAGEIDDEQDDEQKFGWDAPEDDIEAKDIMPMPSSENLGRRSNVQPWFGRIVYFYRAIKKQGARGSLQVHVTWFMHRQLSPLGIVASPRALVFADHCETVTSSAIAARIDIKRVDVKQKPPSEGLYYSHYYDKTDGSWRDFALLLDADNFEFCDKHEVPRCAGCERRQNEFRTSQEDPEPGPEEEGARVPHPVWIEEDKSFLYDDDVYHIGDYVYVSPPPPDKSRQWRQPFQLGRLISVPADEQEPLDRESRMTVQWLFRYDELLQNEDKRRDSMRLVSTDILGTLVEIQDLRGTFSVTHWKDLLEQAQAEVDGDDLTSEEWADVALVWLARQNNRFHCSERFVGDVKDFRGCLEDGNPPRKPLPATEAAEFLQSFQSNIAKQFIPSCSLCEKERRLKREEERRALAAVPKLRGLALYAGADLYGNGLEQGCAALETVAGVEVDPVACLMHRANRNGLTFEETVSDFLERAIEGTLADKAGWKPPRPDAIDVIYAGCPCQGFSQVNKAKKADDLRCAEPWVFLSCMDHWRPLFASFENVREIQRFVLPIEGSPMLLNLVIEVLLELDYQVRPAVLQAAHYGAPQSRRRMILTVAKRGLPLPDAPQPTHAFTDFFASLDPVLYDGFRKIRPQTIRHRDGHAAHPAHTFFDAASDLPAFGYQDPFNDAEQDDQVGLQEWERFVGIGFDRGEAYSSAPMSQLQRESRFDLQRDLTTGRYRAVKSKGIDDQVVPSVSAYRASQLAHIQPRSSESGSHNYEDIPESIETPQGRLALRPPLPPALQQRQYSELFARLEWTDVVSPLRTSMNVDGTSHGRRIHPESARPMSVREAARCQGFSDLDSWSSCDADDVTLTAAYRMIGNAVPRPIGAALGRCLQRALVKIMSERLTAGKSTDEVWADLRRELEVISREPTSAPESVCSNRRATPASCALPQPGQARTSSTASSTSIEVLEYLATQGSPESDNSDDDIIIVDD
ncbi:hypothetical protein ACM66B_005404 [Microbotryomycetes sp. NB124-2]